MTGWFLFCLSWLQIFAKCPRLQLKRAWYMASGSFARWRCCEAGRKSQSAFTSKIDCSIYEDVSTTQFLRRGLRLLTDPTIGINLNGQSKSSRKRLSKCPKSYAMPYLYLATGSVETILLNYLPKVAGMQVDLGPLEEMFQSMGLCWQPSMRCLSQVHHSTVSNTQHDATSCITLTLYFLFNDFASFRPVSMLKLCTFTNLPEVAEHELEG